MKKVYHAILCSAAAAVILGVVLFCSGVVPVSAMSYAMRPEEPSEALRALSLSLPSLPSLPSQKEDLAGETAPTGTLSIPLFSKQNYAVFVPSAPQGANVITKKTYASSLSVNNNSPTEIDVNELLAKIPDLDLSAEGPQILIVHTHTSESYNETGQNWYTDNDIRTADNSRNMVHMGNILEEELTRRGYNVIHCQKRHDEDFNQSYTLSNITVREYLEKYPSIAVVIDLHRDSLIDAAGTKYRPVTEINGESVAQIMLLMGVGNSTYPHPTWEENMSLALRIQQQGNLLYPGLMRPILVRPSRYNQYLSKGAVLVELGACGNTPAEAEAAARIFGEICAKALDQIRKEQS